MPHTTAKQACGAVGATHPLSLTFRSRMPPAQARRRPLSIWFGLYRLVVELQCVGTALAGLGFAIRSRRFAILAFLADAMAGPAASADPLALPQLANLAAASSVR